MSVFSLVFFYLYYISVYVFFSFLISILYVYVKNALIKIILKKSSKT